MFTFFGKIKIGVRLVAMLTLPIVGLLIFSTILTQDKKQVASEMGRTYGQVQLGMLVGALVHEIQNERGLSVEFLGFKSGGSRGSDYAARLAEQRQKTDQERKKLLIFVDQLANDSLNTRLSGKIKVAIDGLVVLGDLRNKVDGHTFSFDQSLNSYTSIVHTFIAILDESVNSVSDARVALAITGYMCVVSAKEDTGQEYALGALAFAEGVDNPKVQERFVALISRENAFLDVFKKMAMPDQIVLLSHAVSGSEADSVERLRKIAINSRFKMIEGDAAKHSWFDVMTARINLLQNVETKVGTDMIALVEKLKREAEISLLLTSGVSFVMILITLLLSAAATYGIISPLLNITAVMESLVKRDKNVAITTKEGNDEISALHRAAEAFRRNMIMGEMNSIISFAQMTDGKHEEGGDKLPEEYLEIVLKAGTCLLDLLSDVRETVTAEKKGMPLVCVPIAAAVTESLSEVASLAHRDGIHLVNNVPVTGEIPNALAHPDRLARVLTGLFSAAIENCQNGGVVTVRIDAKDRHLRLTTTDDGPGIPKDAIGDLFNPMLTVASLDIKGAGVGLALVRKMIETMQGKFGIESVVGKGTTYWVELPIA